MFVAVCAGWFLLALVVGLIIGRVLRVAGDHDTGLPAEIPDFVPDDVAPARRAA